MSLVETPLLARAYKASIQRVDCDVHQFNSNAAYVLIAVHRKRTFVWTGSACSETDKTLAESFAFQVVNEDFNGEGNIESISEAKERASILDEMMDIMYSHNKEYYEAASARPEPIKNTSVALNAIERHRTDRELYLKPICRASVGANGEVAKLPFLKSVNGKTAILLTEGSVYTLWLGELVSRRQQAEIKRFVTNVALEKLPPEEREAESFVFAKSLLVLGKSANVLFRCHFQPETLHVFLNRQKTDSPGEQTRGNPGGALSMHCSDSDNTDEGAPGVQRFSYGETDIQGDACTDCVSETLLRLLGLSACMPFASEQNEIAPLYDSEPSYVSQTPSKSFDPEDEFFITETFVETDPPTPADCKVDERRSANGSIASPSPLPMSFESFFLPLRPDTPTGTVVGAKIRKAETRTNVRFLHPPRRGARLLVLDLDHTLIDFSQRFDFSMHDLRRPHLDSFLTQVYAYYDIAIWSQTNWKWLELKLNEVGVLTHPDYKICFALDKSSMFSVNSNHVKPLEVIWNKFRQRWGPHNTIHVDDLARNFELNPQNGVLIRPFYIRPHGPAMTPRSAERAGSGIVHNGIDCQHPQRSNGSADASMTDSHVDVHTNKHFQKHTHTDESIGTTCLADRQIPSEGSANMHIRESAGDANWLKESQRQPACTTHVVDSTETSRGSDVRLDDINVDTLSSAALHEDGAGEHDDPINDIRVGSDAMLLDFNCNDSAFYQSDGVDGVLEDPDKSSFLLEDVTSDVNGISDLTGMVDGETKEVTAPKVGKETSIGDGHINNTHGFPALVVPNSADELLDPRMSKSRSRSASRNEDYKQAHCGTLDPYTATELLREASRDVELLLLARYLVRIARKGRDFTQLSHGSWREVAVGIAGDSPKSPVKTDSNKSTSSTSDAKAPALNSYSTEPNVRQPSASPRPSGPSTQHTYTQPDSWEKASTTRWSLS